MLYLQINSSAFFNTTSLSDTNELASIKPLVVGGGLICIQTDQAILDFDNITLNSSSAFSFGGVMVMLVTLGDYSIYNSTFTNVFSGSNAALFYSEAS